jgi:hypothetical protein
MTIINVIDNIKNSSKDNFIENIIFVSNEYIIVKWIDNIAPYFSGVSTLYIPLAYSNYIVINYKNNELYKMLSSSGECLKNISINNKIKWDVNISHLEQKMFNSVKKYLI